MPNTPSPRILHHTSMSKKKKDDLKQEVIITTFLKTSRKHLAKHTMQRHVGRASKFMDFNVPSIAHWDHFRTNVETGKGL